MATRADFDSGTSNAGRPVQVLLVEDDDEVRSATLEALEDAGFGVLAVAGGLAAIEYLRRHPPPWVVVLDLMMPEISGWEVAKEMQLSARLRNIPIVVMTAAGPHWGYPSAHVLRKPLGRNELILAVRNAMKPPAEEWVHGALSPPVNLTSK